MNSGKNDQYRTVYSTDVGSICAGCSKPESKCVCKELEKNSIKGDGKVRVRKETGGRKGKTVTTVRGLAINGHEMASLLSDLKKRCGSGGTVKDGILEIQGEHVDNILSVLTAKGIKAKAG